MALCALADVGTGLAQSLPPLGTAPRRSVVDRRTRCGRGSDVACESKEGAPRLPDLPKKRNQWTWIPLDSQDALWDLRRLFRQLVVDAVGDVR